MTSPKAVYDALVQAGASTVEAVGIMANMINESGFDPEARGDQGTSFGLVQQHGNYSYLVTGNPAKDMAAQIALLKSLGGFGAASGSTAAQAAGNFAANYERCQGCQPGGAQYNQRVSNAAKVMAWLETGKWPTSGGSGGGGGGGGSGSGSGGGAGEIPVAGDYTTNINPLVPADSGIQTASFIGDIFSTVLDPFKELVSAEQQTQNVFLKPYMGLLEVFKNLVTQIAGITGALSSVLHDVMWLFNPGHWIRIACFLGGILFAIPALYALMHTGTGDTYLAMGIALTVVSAGLLFLAFHNLPFVPPTRDNPKPPAGTDNVITFQSLLAYISQGIRQGSDPAQGAQLDAYYVDSQQSPASGPVRTAAAIRSALGFGSFTGPSATGFTPAADATGIFPIIVPGGGIIGPGGISPTPTGLPPTSTTLTGG